MSLYLLSIEPIILKSKSVYFCFNIVAAFAQYINLSLQDHYQPK